MDIGKIRELIHEDDFEGLMDYCDPSGDPVLVSYITSYMDRCGVCEFTDASRFLGAVKDLRHTSPHHWLPFLNLLKSGISAKATGSKSIQIYFEDDSWNSVIVQWYRGEPSYKCCARNDIFVELYMVYYKGNRYQIEPMHCTEEEVLEYEEGMTPHADLMRRLKIRYESMKKWGVLDFFRRAANFTPKNEFFKKCLPK